MTILSLVLVWWTEIRVCVDRREAYNIGHIQSRLYKRFYCSLFSRVIFKIGEDKLASKNFLFFIKVLDCFIASLKTRFIAEPSSPIEPTLRFSRAQSNFTKSRSICDALLAVVNFLLDFNRVPLS